MVQFGPASFWDDVDFSNATVTGLTTEPGTVVSTGKVNALLANDTTNQNSPNTAIVPLLAAAEPAQLQLIRENGNFLVPSRVLNGQRLARIGLAGAYDSNGYHWSNGVMFDATTMQDWDATHRGTRLDISVAPNDGVTPIASLALVGGSAAGVAADTWILGRAVLTSSLFVNGQASFNGKPLVARKTWGTITTTINRGAFNANTVVTLTPIAQRLATLLIDLSELGLAVTAGAGSTPP
jgi:hypothetical protein